MKAEEKGLWDGDGSGEAADFELSDFAAAAEKFRMDTVDKNYGSDAVIAKVEDDPLERLLREDAAAVAERQALEDDGVPEWAMEGGGGDDDANDDTFGDNAEPIHVDKQKSNNLMAALGVSKSSDGGPAGDSSGVGTSMGGGSLLLQLCTKPSRHRRKCKCRHKHKHKHRHRHRRSERGRCSLRGRLCSSSSNNNNSSNSSNSNSSSKPLWQGSSRLSRHSTSNSSSSSSSSVHKQRSSNRSSNSWHSD